MIRVTRNLLSFIVMRLVSFREIILNILYEEMFFKSEIDLYTNTNAIINVLKVSR